MGLHGRLVVAAVESAAVRRNAVLTSVLVDRARSKNPPAIRQTAAQLVKFVANKTVVAEPPRISAASPRGRTAYLRQVGSAITVYQR